MDYQFQRIGKFESTIADNLSRVCRELVTLGEVGQYAAGRVQVAGEAFERFTSADLLGFLDPEGTEQAASREQVQSARWLVIARNALFIGLVLFTLLSLSWTISLYQVDLATHPADDGQSFLALWLQAFKTGNPLLSFLFFVIVEVSLVVLVIPTTVLTSRSILRARLAGQKVRARLEEAMRLLVPLLPPQPISEANPIWVTRQETIWLFEALNKNLKELNYLLHRLSNELEAAKGAVAQQFKQTVQSLDTMTRSLNQTSQTMQRIENDTRSALEAIPKRLQEWQLSSSYPKVVQIETQQTLSVYSYMAAALQAILIDLVKSKGRLLSDLRKRASVLVSQGAVLSIIPTCEGVRFIPERVSLNLLQNWGSADFAFVASKELAQKRRPIEIIILAGPIIIASITMEISFVSDQHLHPTASQQSISLPPLPSAAPAVPETERGRAVARRYEHVFASYSHEDISVVLAYKDFCTALGITLDWDADTLKPGEDWNEALHRLIREADIFQLFWSSHSEKSKYVRDEWTYARSLGKERFIRPVYWEKPLPPPPKQLAHLHFVYTPLSQLRQRRRKVPR
jgi:hypothetical protein